MIRQVKISELPELVPMGREFYEDAKLPGGFSPECFVRNWTGMIESGIGVIFGLMKEGKFVGGIGGSLSMDPNNDDLIAIELFWFVTKEHRGGGIALLEAYETWCEEKGVKRIYMVYMLSSMPEVVKAIYEKKGYAPTEVHWMRRV